MLQDTFTAWDMPNVDLDGYSLRLNAKDSRNQAAQYVVEKEDPEGVTRSGHLLNIFSVSFL